MHGLQRLYMHGLWRLHTQGLQRLHMHELQRLRTHGVCRGANFSAPQLGSSQLSITQAPDDDVFWPLWALKID